MICSMLLRCLLRPVVKMLSRALLLPCPRVKLSKRREMWVVKLTFPPFKCKVFRPIMSDHHTCSTVIDSYIRCCLQTSARTYTQSYVSLAASLAIRSAASGDGPYSFIAKSAPETCFISRSYRIKLDDVPIVASPPAIWAQCQQRDP